LIDQLLKSADSFFNGALRHIRSPRNRALQTIIVT